MIDLEAIRARDAKFSIPAMWVAIDGPCAGTDRSDLLRYVDELLRVVEQRASECAECGGSGRLTIYAHETHIGDLGSPIGDEPCFFCADLREVLPG